MFVVRALCLLICVAVAFANENEVERVAGGKNARLGQFPFVASVRTRLNTHLCAAGIISNRFLISAAHCTRGTFSRPSAVFVVVGAIGRTDGKTLRTDRIFVHPNHRIKHFRYNICVIRTAEVIQFNRNVRALTLPTTDSDVVAPAYFAGWGLTRSMGANSRPAIMQWMQTETMPRRICHQRHSNMAVHVDPKSFCTNSREGVGACSGDMGGPLFNKAGVILGIASITLRCENRQPDVFTRVFPYLPFIRTAVNAP